MKLIIRFFLVAFLFINFQTSFAQKDTLRVLFVGNSYTYYNNLPNVVSKISKSTKTYIYTEMSTVGGARLKYHFNQEHSLKTKDLIKNGNFDIVVLQEQSMGTITNKEEFLLFSKKLSDYIKLHNAKPYFFSTWSRKKTPETQSTITNAYKEATIQNKGVQVLVGEAWAKSTKIKPENNLYHKDGSHPNPLGTFLAACVFVKHITGELPTIVNNSKTKLLDLSNSQFCLQIANSIVEY